MLSLSDQLLKFENLTYQNNLDNIITVEDGFSNGSVTIRDLVKQNHTIIHQFKKMKNVFINYTKINKKIYDRVTQHQLSFGANILKLGNLTNFFQSTIQGTIDKMKLIYEDTLHQNRMCWRNMQQLVGPLNEAIKQKVDKSYFEKQMKALNGSSENGEQQQMMRTGQQYVKRRKESTRGQQVLQKKRQQKVQREQNIMIPNLRKSKKVSSEQINNIKQAIFVKIQQRNKQMMQKIEQIKQQLQNEKGTNRKNLQQIYFHMTNKIQQKFNDQHQINSKQIKRLQSQLQQKTSQNIWQRYKYQITKQIHQKYIKAINQNIILLKINLDKTQKNNLRYIHQQRSQIQTLIQQKQTYTLNTIKQQNDKIIKKIHTLNTHIQDIKKQIKDNKHSIMQNIDSFKKQNKNQHHLFHNLITDLKQTIQKISLTLQAVVFKAVTKKFQESFNSLTAQFQKIKIMEIQTSKKVVRIFQNIQDMKQVISKKANFSDIYQLFDKKASKQQILEIKDLIMSSQTPKKQLDLSVIEHQIQTARQKYSSDHQIKRSSQTTRKISPQRSAQKSFILGLNRTQKYRREKTFQSKKLKYRPITAVFD